MSGIVECVPNFSEGRRSDVIDAISDAIKDTNGCTLLDVDSGISTNRTVYTFVGSPSSVVEGALNAAKVAFKLIDMTKHKGDHPRMGALDVCPFVPVSGVTMEDCIECSHKFGCHLADSLNVPVYLYEYSATKDYRKTLPQIRSGEYEGLKDKLTDVKWNPDFGPAEFIPSWGATVTGARKFLIAYNVNLLSTKQQAHRIALDIREYGRGPDKPGSLKCVKAIGWYLEEKDLSQVSMNLTDFETTPIHTAYEECVENATKLNLPVVGSEIVGLVPLKSILMVADYYIEKEKLFILQVNQKIMLAVERLGLNSVSQFKPQEKIIEYSIGANTDGPLLSSSVRNFIESIGARTSTPGGGSASACIASIGSALGSMVGFMTYGKRQYESLDHVIRQAITPLYTITQELMILIDSDTQAFNKYMEALKMSQSTEEEKQKRHVAMQAGLKEAVSVPLNLMRTAHKCWPHLHSLAEHGNIQTMSDLQVSASSLETGVFGGYCNVIINLKSINDTVFVEETKQEVGMILDSTRAESKSVLDTINKRLII